MSLCFNSEAHLIILEYLDGFVAGCLFSSSVGGYEVHWLICNSSSETNQEAEIEAADFTPHAERYSQKLKVPQQIAWHPWKEQIKVFDVDIKENDRSVSQTTRKKKKVWKKLIARWYKARNVEKLAVRTTYFPCTKWHTEWRHFVYPCKPSQV